MGFVIPDVDIWVRGLSRHLPDPKVVYRIGEHVKKRELMLTPFVRHAVLARTHDDRQLARAHDALAAFPDVVARADDVVEAARLVQRMRGKHLDLPIAAAAMWALALRLKAKIWSNDSGWRLWQQHDCPVIG